MKQRSNYLNKTFGQLKVTHCVEPSDGTNEGGKWMCMCKCRRMITLTGYQLHSRKSCGCLAKKAREQMGRNNRKSDEDKELTKRFREYRKKISKSMQLTRDQWIEKIKSPCNLCGDTEIGFNKIELTVDTHLPICRRCKEMKGDISIEEFIQCVQNIYKNKNQPENKPVL